MARRRRALASTPRSRSSGSVRAAFSAVVDAVGSTTSSTSGPRQSFAHLLGLRLAAVGRPPAEDHGGRRQPGSDLLGLGDEPAAAAADGVRAVPVALAGAENDEGQTVHPHMVGVSSGVSELAAIGITSSDLARSAAFYRLLGVDVPEPDGDHLDVTLPSGVRLMWDTVELMQKLDPDWTEPRGQRMSLAFECPSPQAVDELHARIVDAGFDSKDEPFDAFWGQRYANVVDPDDNVVSLFAPLS